MDFQAALHGLDREQQFGGRGGIQYTSEHICQLYMLRKELWEIDEQSSKHLPRMLINSKKIPNHAEESPKPMLRRTLIAVNDHSIVHASSFERNKYLHYDTAITEVSHNRVIAAQAVLSTFTSNTKGVVFIS